MTTSRSFDRAADIYDQTRDLPEPIASHGIQALMERAGANAFILEVGAGTGRISVPMLERGANLMGCDISMSMMARLREKIPAARLAQADAARLPFVSGRFDALITVHVLHLVGGWREALREFKRVLKPQGRYINGWTWQASNSALARARNYWWSRAEARGAERRRPGVQNREALLDEVKGMGAAIEEIEVLRFETPLAPRKVIETIAQRIFSDTWEIPEQAFQASLRELREWAAHEYTDIDQPVAEERRFMLDVVRFGD
jgi:ubiquinone/menaquinone biosynthesis C-methylase UbiE